MLKLGRARLKRKWMTTVFIAVGCGLLVLFQNFSSIPLENLKPRFNMVHARVVNPHDGSADARDLAPTRPEGMDPDLLAVPQSGHDLQSVSEDWMRRQAHLITGGAEQEMLDKLNRRLGSIFSESGEEDGNVGHGEKAHDSTSGKESDSAFVPTSLQFTALNRLQLGFGQDLRVTCSFQGSSMQWDLVRPLNTSFDMNLRHESSSSKSSVLLNYSW